jgi:pSer/pThr/pTyr-binding forkhead associated (FHA) protein
MPEIIVKLGDEIKQKYYLYKDSVTIGRAPENEIAIENLAVSRRHAEIGRDNGSYVIEDLNSANGTFVNGVQVTRTEIVDKDVISIGKHKLYFYNQQVAPMQMVEKTMLVTRPAATKAMLRVVKGKQTDQVFELSKVENRIGRATDNEIRLGDWFVSKHHAEIVRKGMVYVLRDLDSWRHTTVNGQIVDEQVLKPGDEIQFGPKISMVFEVAEGTAAREGSGRKPVELENIDKPLPIAGADPNTPLPIAGSMSRPAPAHAERDNVQSNGITDPQLDEGWDEDFDPEALVDSESEAPGQSEELATFDEEEFVDEHSDSKEASVAAEAEFAPVRLDDEEPEMEAGWDEAGAMADGLGEADDLDAEPFKAGASDSWSPENVSESGDDGDAVSIEASESVEWVAEIDDRVEQEMAEAPSDLAVASPDSEGLESGAETGDPSIESLEVEADIEPETPEVAEAPNDEEVRADVAIAKAVDSGQDSLLDSIMEEHGDAKALDRSEVEVWVKALCNPSKIIRKQAQRRLQKLTGQVYDIE